MPRMHKAWLVIAVLVVLFIIALGLTFSDLMDLLMQILASPVVLGVLLAFAVTIIVLVRYMPVPERL